MQALDAAGCAAVIRAAPKLARLLSTLLTVDVVRASSVLPLLLGCVLRFLALESLPGTSEYELSQRVKAALIVVSLSPDFVIQK